VVKTILKYSTEINEALADDIASLEKKKPKLDSSIAIKKNRLKSLKLMMISDEERDNLEKLSHLVNIVENLQKYIERDDVFLSDVFPAYCQLIGNLRKYRETLGNHDIASAVGTFQESLTKKYYKRMDDLNLHFLSCVCNPRHKFLKMLVPLLEGSDEDQKVREMILNVRREINEQFKKQLDPRANEICQQGIYIVQ
jgi:hypothetical protein